MSCCQGCADLGVENTKLRTEMERLTQALTARDAALQALEEQWRVSKPERFGEGYGAWHQGQINAADDLAALRKGAPR